jgi:hypothetical protein
LLNKSTLAVPVRVKGMIPAKPPDTEGQALQIQREPTPQDKVGALQSHELGWLQQRIAQLR